MLKQVVEQSKLDSVIAYLEQDTPNCLYLLIDLTVYGLTNPNITVWCDEDAEGIRLVVMQYHTSFQLYTNRDYQDHAALIDLIRQRRPYGISGREELISAIADELPEYHAEYGFVLKGPERELPESEVTDSPFRASEGVPADAEEIARLICTDELMGTIYTVDSLAAELRERMETGVGRSFVVRDGERIVAHDSVSAEGRDFRIISGLIVDPEYRDTDCFSVLGSFMGAGETATNVEPVPAPPVQ